MNYSMEFRFRRFALEAGDLALIHERGDRVHTQWLRPGTVPFDGAVEDASILPELGAALTRYFEGDMKALLAVPTPQGPPFFHACWAASRSIRPSETISYRELASRAGNRRATRAAGQAMRRNPLAVFVPCHRVVSSSGSLYGYGGETANESWLLSIKRWLLDHERTSTGKISVQIPKMNVNAWQHETAVAQ